jgi:hypothetical protein
MTQIGMTTRTPAGDTGRLFGMRLAKRTSSGGAAVSLPRGGRTAGRGFDARWSSGEMAGSSRAPAECPLYTQLLPKLMQSGELTRCANRVLTRCRKTPLFDHLVGAGKQRRRDSDTEKSFLGMLFIASARYWIKFVHTAKNKTKPHAITINTNQIAIFPNLGTCP